MSIDPGRIPDLAVAKSEIDVNRSRFFISGDLLERRVLEERKWCAVRAVGRFLKREQRQEVIEIDKAKVSAPPKPPQVFTEIPVEQRYFSQVSADKRECSHCVVPGRALCSTCGGQGFLTQQVNRYSSATDSMRTETVQIDCGSCNGGYTFCVPCAGTNSVHQARVHYITDETHVLDRVFIPGGFGSSLAIDFMEHAKELEGTAELTIEPKRAGSAYRDQAFREEDCAGFQYGDALKRARADARFFLKDSLKHELHLYAIPFLELTFHRSKETVLLWRKDDGTHEALTHEGLSTPQS